VAAFKHEIHPRGVLPNFKVEKRIGHNQTEL